MNKRNANDYYGFIFRFIISDLTSELKVYLMKFFEDVLFRIDITCQSKISKKKNEGIDCKALEHRYIHEFIGRLKIIEDSS